MGNSLTAKTVAEPVEGRSAARAVIAGAPSPHGSPFDELRVKRLTMKRPAGSAPAAREAALISG